MADNKKLRNKTKKQSDESKINKKNLKVLEKQASSLDRQSNLTTIQNKLIETQKTADRLFDLGQEKDAKKIQKSIDDLNKLLSKGGLNSKTIDRRLKDLEIAEKASTAVLLRGERLREKSEIEALGKLEEGEQKDVGTSLDALTKKLQDQTDTLKAETTLGTRELGKRLSKLSLGSMSKEEKETALNLQKAFTSAQKNLKDAIESGDAVKIKAARDQVSRLDDTVQSEEDRREQAQKQRDANSTLLRIKDGVDGFNSKLADMASGGGFVAGLAAIALAVFSPETLSAVVRKFINWFTAIVDALEALINGDMETFKKTFNENLTLFASLAGLLLVYFGPKLLGLMTTVTNTIKGVRTFMTVTALPAISSFFTGMMTSVSAMLVPMLPAIAIGAGIVAVLGVLLIAFNKLKESLGPGASIVDTLKVAGLFLLDFLAMLVNGITFIPRKLIDLLGPTVAKFIMGDDFDTSAIEAIGEGFDTGRGKREIEKQRRENEARVKQEEEEARLLAERQSKIEAGELPGDMLDLLGKENADVIADLRAQGIQLPSTAAMSQSTINSSSSQSTTIITERPSRSASILSIYSPSSFR